MTASTTRRPQTWLSREDCDISEFRALVEVPTVLADYPHADAVERNVLIYGQTLRAALDAGAGLRDIKAELVHALMDGPGIAVFKHAYQDAAVIDRATDAFNELIAEQRARGVTDGDHFAPPGANDRVWGALEKLAVHRPDVFADYYANDIVALAAASWLGPNYQVTSDLNIVNPGGQAQTAHPGYLATDLPEFAEYFRANHVQLPLAKGDAVFFNPALFHGAGTNHSADVKRMANLLQVSSAFGRGLGTVNRVTVCKAIYPTLLARKQAGAAEQELRTIIAAAAEGYPFPTNLDLDQPIGSLNPETQAELTWRALQENWDHDSYVAALIAQDVRHQSN